jgi:hypothetical protein
MLSLKILLRQRYSLSFITTTLLMALTTESSLAFSINPPGGGAAEYLPVQTYTYRNDLDIMTFGLTTLNPANVRSITRGGTTGFLTTLKMEFQDWTFNPAPTDLAGSFRVQKYIAKYLPQDAIYEAGVGAELKLQYDYNEGDPKPEDSKLHWIQRVVSNHRGTHGTNQDNIDIRLNAQNPYYDTAFGEQPFDERTFYDRSTREVENSHNWLAELYLVKETAPKQVTIYNGIQWGWSNNSNIHSVPEPLTIFASGVSLGFGALFKKNVQENKRKQKVSKS